MKTKLGAGVVVLAFAVWTPAHATNGMRMTGFGAVQSSMGGTGVGVSLDGATMLSNPAGLTELDARIDLSASYFKPTVSYRAAEAQMPPGFAGAIVAQPNVELDSSRGASPIPSLAIVLPASSKLTFGLGLFAVSGMGVDYAQNLYGGGTLSSYLQARVTPAVAYALTDRISVGVAVNAMFAQMKWDVAQGMGQVPHDTASALGLGATLGLKVRPLEGLSFGAAYESRSYFQDFSFEVDPHSAMNPATFQPVMMAGGTETLSFDQPMSVTLGAAVNPLGDLVVLAADLQWINWSGTNGSNQPEFSSDVSTTGAMPWNLDWSDQVVIKLGAQIRPIDALRIRIGYNYGKMPLNSVRAFENIAFPAIAEHHISAGLGYDVGPLTINLGATFSPQSTLTGSNPSYPAQGGQAIATYTTEMSQYMLDLGLAYRL